MQRAKTKPLAPKVGSGELKVLRKVNQYEFEVELMVMRDGENNNHWDYRNLDKYYETFCGAPILCAYVGRKIGDGHNMRMKRDPETGEKYYSFTDATAERIVGTISDNEEDLTLVRQGDHTWIKAKGRLWSFYAPELVEKIVRTGRMEVSAETEVTRSVEENGVEVFYDWSGLGVTILGDDVQPAIPGAQIAKLTELRQEFNQLKLRAAALEKKERQLEKTTEEGVKRMNKRVIEEMESKFEGYKIVGASEDGKRLALVDATGAGYLYEFAEGDNGCVVPERIKPAMKLTGAFLSRGDKEGVAVDIDKIVDHAIRCASENNEETERVRAELNQAKETITKMEQAENERRVQAVKDVLAATLKEIVNAEEDEIAEEELSADCEDLCENAAKFAEMEKEGKFCGDQAARDALLAKAMEKRVERMERNKKDKAFTWGRVSEGKEDGDGIEAMLSFING